MEPTPFSIFQAILEATKEFRDESLFLSHITRLLSDHFRPDTFIIYLHYKQPPHLRPHLLNGDLPSQQSASWLNLPEKSPNNYRLPLTIKKQQLGFLYTQSLSSERYNSEYKQLLTIIADQIALAIHWLRAESSHFQRTQQEIALSEMGQMLTSSLDLEQVLQRILDYITYLVNADGISVMLLEPDEQTLTFMAVSGAGASRLLGYKMPAAAGIAGQVLQTGSIQLINQRQDAAIYENAEQIAQYQAQTLFALPLEVNQQIIGVLEAVHHQPYAFGEEDLLTLSSAATWAAIAITNAKLFGYIQQARKQTETLRQVATILNGTLDQQQVLQLILAQLSRVIEYDVASIMLKTGDMLRVAAYYDSENQPPRLQEIAVNNLPHIQAILESQTPIVVNDTGRDSQWKILPDSIPVGSWIGVPLVVKNSVIGLLNLNKRQAGFYHHEQSQLAYTFANQAAIAVHNAMLYEAERNQFHKLQDSQARLIQAEKLAALGRMTASVAHEINNPIQVIQGCLTLALEDLTSNPQSAITYLNIVQTEIDRIAALARRMHDFYRPSAQEAYYPTHLPQVIEEVLRLAHKHLQNRQVQIIRDLAQKLPPVQAQPNQLKQVFLNIILNALDAMPEGGSLHISLKDDSSWSSELNKQIKVARLEFNNSGEPIPAHLLPRLFEPFFSTKEHGSGLGLSISYTIIQAHQGDIFITSTALSGTTVTVLLPLIAA